MADTSGIKAGRAYVELGVGDKLTAGLKHAQARLKAFGAAMTAMGTKVLAVGLALAAPLVVGVKNFITLGDAIAKMSRRTGVGVEALSELAYAAELSGTSMEGLENGLRKMQRTTVDASMGLKTAKDALAMVGLSAKKLKGLKPEDQFTVIAEALSRIEDPTRKAAIAMMIFGRSGTALLPMIEKGAAGMNELRKKARDLGLTMSTEDAAAAEKLQDAFTAVWRVIKQVGFAIGAALAPQLTDITEKAAAWTSTAITWINQNKGMIVSVAKLAAGAIGAGAALIIAGKAVTLFASLIGAAATILGIVLSPIGAVIVAFGALGAYMLTATTAGAKALDWLGGKFGDLQDDATAAFDGISDALAAGDIGLAAKVLWSMLKLEWARGGAALTKFWNDDLLDMRKAFIEAWGGIRSIFAWVTHALEIGWIETTSFLADTWSGFVNGVLTAWNWVGNKLTKAWNWIKGLFDDSFDVEAANAAADKAYEATKANLDKETAAKKKGIETERVAARNAEQKAFEEKISNIAFETLARTQALDKDAKAKIKAAQDGVDAAKKEFDELRKKAKAARKEREADAGPGKLEGPEALLDRIGAAASGLGEQIKIAATPTRGITATSAAAIQSLQTTPTLAKMGNDIAALRKSNEKILAAGGPKF